MNEFKKSIDTLQEKVTQNERLLNTANQKLDTMAKYFFKGQPKKMLQFEIHIAEHCNLNCKSCSHFSPLAKEGFLDVNLFEKDIRRLSELTDGQARYIYLLGGEPLLNPEVNEFMKIARRYFPNESNIGLITNGILLAQQKNEFWRICKENKIIIMLTRYPGLSISYNKIEAIAASFGVKFKYFGAEKSNAFWHLPLDCSGYHDAVNSFFRCHLSNNCISLFDGKLSTCTMIPNIRHFNNYYGKNCEISNRDYIDIYEAKDIDDILEFLSKPVPFCRYCAVPKWTYCNEWKVSTRDIKEWSL